MNLTRRDLILVASGAAIAALLIAALVLRQGGSSAGTEGTAPPTGEGAEAAPGEAAPEAAPSPAESPAATPEEPSFISEQNRREVTLFYQESSGDSLAPEKRKIFETSSPTDQAKQIVGELINGPRDPGLLPTLPPETRLLGLYLDRYGTAYVDLSEEVVSLHPGGSSEELATVFSVVDSLTYNLPQIKRVHILVGGEERETLKSHLDLRRDYRQDLSIVDMDRRPAS
jgi:germination protein M